MCLCPVALSKPDCRLGASDVGAPFLFHLQCVQLPPMRRCQMSDINIGLTLKNKLEWLHVNVILNWKSLVKED